MSWRFLRRFRAKTSYWLSITRYCFCGSNPLLVQAKELCDVALDAIRLSGETKRDDFTEFYRHACHPDILASFAMIIDLHDAVTKFSLVGHHQNAMGLLRMQMDALLLLLYFTEPYGDFNLIKTRIDEYMAWLLIRMKKNVQQTEKYGLVHEINAEAFEEYKKQVLRENDAVVSFMADQEELYRRLTKSNSFPLDRAAVAERHGLLDLFRHINAESSATLHLADFSDRFNTVLDSEGSCIVRVPSHSQQYWAAAHANITMSNGIRVFADFLGTTDAVISRCKDGGILTLGDGSN